MSHEEVAEAFERLGTVIAVSRELGIARSTVRYHLSKAGAGKKPLAAGRLRAERPAVAALPKSGVKRYILTSAQNNTHVNKKVWESLQALARHYDAQVIIGSYSYNQNGYGQTVKRGTEKHEEGLWYDPAIAGYLDEGDADIQLAPGLVWAGRLNIIPTAARPLSGLESYTSRQSMIAPHAKVAMVSVASMADEPAKLMFTTGTVTQVNYLQRKAGLLAGFHHVYGGVLVEVDAEGHWWVRQLTATADGEIQDLDVRVKGGKITTDNRIEALNVGDVHAAQLDPETATLLWGEGGIVRTLKPRYQLLHDVLDFQSRSHHGRADPHRMYKLWNQDRDDVAKEIAGMTQTLAAAAAAGGQLVIVDSNHDRHLTRWLKETDWRDDLPNAEFWLEAQARSLRAIREEDQRFHLLEWAALRAGGDVRWKWLRPDESFVICRSDHGGIECGAHGDAGPNGARGQPLQFAKLGRRFNTGHTHSAGIIDGVYTAGTSSVLRPDYVRGPSSWSHSHIVTYPNGKRAIITTFAGKWRA